MKHVKLTPEQKLFRDKYEEATTAAGKELGYKRTPEQAEAAKRNVASNGNAAPADKGGKGGKGGKSGKTNGKGKTKRKCWYHLDGQVCPHGANCWNRADTPGHP